MPSAATATFSLPPPFAPPSRNGFNAIALGFVWLAVATSMVVFSEPAPTDGLTVGLVFFLPMLGLVRIHRLQFVPLVLWLVVIAASAFATLFASDPAKAATHTAITLYLCLAAFVFGAFVARHPTRHAEFVISAYLFAATVAALIGIVGYFDLMPGAANHFTRHARATATFKDPNVFGPFLVPAMIVLLDRVLTRPALRAVWPCLLLAVVGLALVVSFSRGAWINFAIAAAIYVALALATAPNAGAQVRMVLRLVLISLVATAMLAIALSTDGVARLFDERLALLLPYDVGPEGRFGGQLKAIGVILESPFGIGPATFAQVHHHEEAHNVFLSMLLGGGWLAGFAYAAIILVTLVAGFVHATRRTPTRSLFIVIYAAFAGVALEGVIVDTEHWRNFFLLQGMLWGLMSIPRRATVIRTRRSARLVRAVPVRYAIAHAGRELLRPARITGIARRRLPRHIALPRRVRISRPRRPARIAYHRFAGPLAH